MNLELIIEEIKNALGWTAEQVTSYYPMLLKEYQMYSIFRELNYTFGFLWIFSGIGFVLLSFISSISIDSEEKTKIFKTKKLLSKLFFIFIALSSLSSILQTLLAPNINLIMDLLNNQL